MDNIKITDSLLQGMNVTKISDYLRSKGWQAEEKIGDKATVWANEDYEVIVPLRQELRDYTKRIVELLEILEESEERPRIDILNDLLEPSQVSSLMGREIIMFSMNFSSEYGSEAPIHDMSRMLFSLQDLIYQLGKRQVIKNHTSEESFDESFARLETQNLKKDTKKELDLTAFGTFEGSFGIKLASSRVALLSQSRAVMPNTINDLYALLSAGDNIEVLQPLLAKVKVLAAKKYVSFLKTVKNAQANLFFEWGSTNPQYGGSCRLSYDLAKSIIKSINRINSEEKTVIHPKGRLVQGHVETRHFVFRTEEGEEYSGYISREAMPTSGELHLTTCSPTIERTVRRYFTTNKVEVNDVITYLGDDYIETTRPDNEIAQPNLFDRSQDRPEE